jgi:hypothetical protein
MMRTRYPVVNVANPAGRLGQAGPTKGQKALAMADNVRKNHAKLAALIGRDKADEAVRQAEEAVEAAGGA